MALSNRERLDRGFQELAGGLRPFVDRVMNAAVPGGQKWPQWYGAQEKVAGRTGKINPDDPAVLLSVIINTQKHFSRQLSTVERNFALELREVRNKHAHHEDINSADLFRALDTIERLLIAVGATAEAVTVARLRDDHQRGAYEKQAKNKAVRTSDVATPGAGGLKSWREVVRPHDDVALGQFNAAEFAADLNAVATGEGETEYGDPVGFFQRTYLTAGLRDLMERACRRMGGDTNARPVVNLQTNFGGGKTHSMLALYHLFSGTPLDAFPQEVQDLLADQKDVVSTKVARVTLVGHRNLSPSGMPKDDGTLVRTIWGELAWQLGGRDAYEKVRAADESSTAPGAALGELLREHSPCLILIDEWVAYARQLVGAGSHVGGSFDTQFTFAQALTEEAAATPGVLVVLSIPASESADPDAPGNEEEVGGADGREALNRLQNVVRRTADQWRPASSEESFEIVRRRLFQDPSGDSLHYIASTAKKFVSYYGLDTSKGHFPSAASTPDYERRIRDCYPIHPELFDRLYEDWSTLERFQRTRGVLRLMSKVVHELWVSEDASPLINVGSIPLNDDGVLSDLTQYLEDAWKPIIDADIDGKNATSREIDRERAIFGQRSTARRLARATFVSSAPTLRTAHRGVERNRIFLGVAIPGDTVGNFGSAMELLQQRSQYLDADGSRYWYNTSRSIARTATEYAETLSNDPGTVYNEIAIRMRPMLREKGGFAGIHQCPEGSADVPDEPRTRLVVIHPASGYTKGSGSPALEFAKSTLDSRGSAQRSYRSMLVFLAPDAQRLGDLEDATRQAMAWRYLDERSEEENFTPQQVAQIKRRRLDTDGLVDTRLRDTYIWALAPHQTDGSSPDVAWSAHKCEGEGELATRVAQKLANAGEYTQAYSPRTIRLDLDGPLQSAWTDGRITLLQLWEYYARYLYLTRLKDRSVLEDAIRVVTAELDWRACGFALANGFNTKTNEFTGLIRPDGGVIGPLTDATLLVRPDVVPDQPTGDPPPPDPPPTTPVVDPTPAVAAKHKFFASVTLDPTMPAKQFNRAIEDVVAHLKGEGRTVQLKLEIQADAPNGFDGNTVRTVSENASTLKFDTHGFDEQRS